VIQVSEVVVAAEDAAVMIGDVPHVLICGVTMARDSHPIVTGYPGLWKPLDVHYEVDEPAPKAPARTPPAAARKAPG
jgi:hypothetical protein